MAENNNSKKGFASMTPERRKEVASMGGRAAQATGRSHKFTSETARLAGKKGGDIIGANRAHMSEIGAKGGRSRNKALAEPNV